jgi:hypothetical protein
MLIDIKKLTEEAQADVIKEFRERAKERIKAQMKTVENAKIVLANEERKLQDLLTTIGEGN